MAKEKADLKSLSEVDLQSRIAEEEVRLKKLKFGHAVSPIENPMNIRELRRDIARLKTELRTRERGANTNNVNHG
ncbi:50S ribosomal protein L29 [Compostibacter hankyongensis]|uniref:Large ribosomal subunit protein uL29 n=1 Tax=Compostibacter hankyongensis TaxID=1007089 RepID=A0ABP8GAI0_9BACT